ncbi:phage major tail tube protein [Caulobacter segnis]|uniref:Phage tail protein n=1 Tax=Caulobacter segnis TaxID=88688 RepID=A0A2W5VKB0_9CAUL|nr:phage major tail tube protein [Caulobacter segnis]PZR37186.1 MAG: phage tail protein [Caulobacter segnis]
MSKLPSKLMMMNTFLNGYGYGGEAKVVKPPPLKFMTDKHNTEIGPINYRNGQIDELKLEYTLAGLVVQSIRAMGATAIDGVQLRFTGAYQRPDTGETSQAEIVVRGQQNEWDPGDAEVGKDTEHKYVVDCVYYKLTIDGVEEAEIDKLNRLIKIGGVDLTAKLRQAAGGV